MSSQDPNPALGGSPTAEDIRELTSAATPQFALQLRDRVEKLIAGLDPADPARIEGERQVERLVELASEGQASGHLQEHELPLPSLTLDPTRSERSAG